MLRRRTLSGVKALVLDLDGVIRHFDPADIERIELDHDLEPGVLLATAFAPELAVPATTGEMSRSEWAASVGDRVGSPKAAAEWQVASAVVDWELIEVVRATRATGVPAAILTNGTSAIDSELTDLGINHEFDYVFNSFDIGFAKPDHRVFHHVIRRLRLASADVTYLDDTAGHVVSASELGIDARLYEGIHSLRAVLDL